MEILDKEHNEIHDAYYKKNVSFNKLKYYYGLQTNQLKAVLKDDRRIYRLRYKGEEFDKRDKVWYNEPTRNDVAKKG